MITIEQATGWKQLLREGEMVGKTIQKVYQDGYHDLYILFNDKSFVHYETTYDGGDLEFDKYNDCSYEYLFHRYVDSSNKSGYHLELSELGEAFDADLDLLVIIWNQEEIDDKKKSKRNMNKNKTWYESIFEDLCRVYLTAAKYRNPFINDSGGSRCCRNICETIKPIIDELSYDCKRHNKRDY